MTHPITTRLPGTCLALVASVALHGAATAETLVSSNVDARVLVALSAPADGVQAMMPEGWSSVPIPGGPFEGANILFVFIDQLQKRDPQGTALAQANRRAVAVAGLGKQDDGDAVRLYVLRLYTTAPEEDPYGVNVAADVTRTASVTGPANGGRNSVETWQINVAGGGTLDFNLDYTTGDRAWAKAEAFPFSAHDPEFSRIYRVDQLTDLVVSTPMGKPASGDFSLTSSLSDLDQVFDGSEQIVAIVDTPIYVRDIFLP